ncbi:MAG TPA: hypothetical protein VIK78_03570 [Ruminiclostridium sp.]
MQNMLRSTVNTGFQGTFDVGVLFCLIELYHISESRLKKMRRNTEFISQSVAAKIIREVRSRDYGATPAACKNSGKEH